MVPKVRYSNCSCRYWLTFKSGDGSTDDTAAINKAIADGNRCGQGCDSSTVTPALIYFPPGNYLVSSPIIQYYYTQLVGDALSLPTLKAAPAFKGMAVIDSDPYLDGGANWYTNQNNFYRQIRNFVIDLTAMPPSMGAGIHWQVAQATSLQNIRFEMVKGGESNKQQGIFMDNGSGGFMTDLVFNGGNYGMFLGNQQFTTRNLTFNNVGTAVYMNWNWLWTLKSLSINNCGVGVNMSNTPSNMTVGSVIIQDSTFLGTPKGIITAYQKSGGVPVVGNTLVLDNCDFSGCPAAVVDVSGSTILAGGGTVASWAQGHAYSTGEFGGSSSSASAAASATCAASSPKVSGTTIQNTLTAPSKAASLLSNGKIFERSRPQYENVPASSFLSAKANGCKGDGTSDDTAAIQALLDKATKDQIVYFDHGAYVVTSTIKVPKDIRITGEIWPLIMASGSHFASQSSPAPMFQVGQPGDTGAVEMSDLIFTTKGPAPGVILVEWNVAESSQGAAGMWDVHARIGGSAGTGLQSDHCAKPSSSNSTTTTPATTNTATTVADSNCFGAFLLLHITQKATIYLENAWFWVADHELDLPNHSQLNIYSGRGILIESTAHAWLYGTSSEHSQLYNYQLTNAQNIYMGLIQSETPYMQSSSSPSTGPDALSGGFPPNVATTYSDPDFHTCTTPGCKKSWGLRITGPSTANILVYGAGLYSFFDDGYAQSCLATESCQENMVSVETGCGAGGGGVTLWGLSTKASVNMVTLDDGGDGGDAVVPQKDNRGTFCSTVALFEAV